MQFAEALNRDMVLQNDIVVVSISRRAVVEANIQLFREHVKVFESCGLRARGKMLLLFEGYDDDPMEIYHIPAIRAWVKKAFEAVSHFLYWLTPMENNDTQILACLGDPTEIRFGTGERKAISQYIEEGYSVADIPKITMYISLSEELKEKLVRSTVLYGLSVGDSLDEALAKGETLLRVVQ